MQIPSKTFTIEKGTRRKIVSFAILERGKQGAAFGVPLQSTFVGVAGWNSGVLLRHPSKAAFDIRFAKEMRMKYGIGDVARTLGLTPAALHFFEREGVIGPKKGGAACRTYGAEDVIRLISYKKYRSMEMPLKEIAKQFSPQGETCQEAPLPARGGPGNRPALRAALPGHSVV